MTKKEYILKLLEITGDLLPVAEDIKFLINENAISDELLDFFINMFKDAMKATDDAEKQEKLAKSVNFLEKLRELEKEQEIMDENDIEQLDELIQKI